MPSAKVSTSMAFWTKEKRRKLVFWKLRVLKMKKNFWNFLKFFHASVFVPCRRAFTILCALHKYISMSVRRNTLCSLIGNVCVVIFIKCCRQCSQPKNEVTQPWIALRGPNGFGAIPAEFKIKLKKNKNILFTILAVCDNYISC